ncbi:MAG: acylphosphatase [bacterium]
MVHLDSDSPMKIPTYTAHIIVRGRVQGIGFRKFTQDVARRLGLSGSVKNLPNGDVEVWAIGSKENIEQLIKELKVGNGFSIVTDMEVEYQEGGETIGSFKIISDFW